MLLWMTLALAQDPPKLEERGACSRAQPGAVLVGTSGSSRVFKEDDSGYDYEKMRAILDAVPKLNEAQWVCVEVVAELRRDPAKSAWQARNRAAHLIVELDNRGVHRNVVGVEWRLVAASEGAAPLSALPGGGFEIWAVGAPAAMAASTGAATSVSTVPVVGIAPASSAHPSPPTLPSIDARLATGRSAPADAAVVIGIEDYAFVPDVPYATRDAQAFYDLMLYTRGVPRERIAMLTTGSVDHIRKAVQEAGKSVSAGGTVWVYFAGHGAASSSSREQVVLGDDVRPDDVSFDTRSLSLIELQRLATAGGGTAMVVVDACFSGVGRNGESLLGGNRTLVPAKAIQAVATARHWTSTSPGEASVPLPAVQHGAFTYAAVGALRGWADGEFGTKDGKVTADEADAYVSRLLRSLQVRGQTPQFLGSTEVVLSEGATEAGPL